MTIWQISKTAIAAISFGVLVSPLAAGAQIHISSDGTVTDNSRTARPTPTPTPSTAVVEEEAPSSEEMPAQPPNEPAEEVAVAPEQRRQRAQRPRSIDQGGELNLVCYGAGGANRPDIRQNYGSGSGSFTAIGPGGMTSGTFSGSGSGTSFGTRVQGFEDQVTLHITSEEGRLRMPRVMLPAIRGGEDGWFELRNIEVEDGEIRAKVAVNILNRPNLRLDRYTGAISISGKAGNYTGQCERFEPEHTQRQF